MRLCVLLTFFIAGAAGQDPAIYDEPPHTVNGCICTSECKTHFLFHCNSQPVCSVEKASCNKGDADHSLTLGYYDYCKFGKYAKYEDLSANAKEELLLRKIKADTTSGDYPKTLSVLTGIMGESVRVSFEAQSDVFPQERTKFIHSVGAVAPIKWESFGNHHYSGLFQGAEHGLIRFSSAKQPSSSGFTPGVGVKIFRDGRPSANFVAMPSLDGQKCSENNFFEKNFSNHIPTTEDGGLKLIAAKFWQASYCPLMVGLSDLADGPNFPFMLTLRAPAGMSVDCPCNDYARCLANIGALDKGTTIFEVLATEVPHAAPKKIGSITLTGPPTASKFGDEELFFKHQYMEEDFKHHEEWLDFINKKEDCGMQAISTQPPPISAGCKAPFDPSPKMRDDDRIVVT